MSKQNQLVKTVQGAWKARMEEGTDQPWLASLRMRFGVPILGRFQYYYHYLRNLPRRTRRRLKRRLAMSLATAALLLALSAAPAYLTVNASTVTGDTQIAQVRNGGRSGGFGQLSERPLAEVPSVVRGDPALLKGPAATIVVNGNNPGTDCTLGDAIIAANTDTMTGNCTAGTGDDILDIQVNVNLTAPAPVISSTMTLEGNGNTIAGDDTFGPLLTVSATGDMTLNDATVSHGNSANYGGGVFITDGSATINNSTLSYNYAYYGGGGLSNKSGSVVITNSQVISNSSNIHGGGIENSTGMALISGSTITENYAPYGGGIRNEYAGLMTFVDSTISGNRAIGGAGINNSGLYSNMEIENSTVSDNAATVYSGGIDNVSGATLVVNNSTFSNNSNNGNYGGGIYSGFNAPTTLTITDSTITGNSVNGPGAGVWMAWGQGSISRSLISGNTGVGYADETYNTDYLTVDDYNLFGHDGITTTQAIAGFTPGPTDILATSDGTLPTPLTNILDTLLQNNGGSTDTHALPLGSPAVDGVLSGCAAGMEDQRHLPRGGGSGMGGPFCDIGAYEVQSPNTMAKVFMPAVLKADTAQNNTQAARPSSLVMRLLVGMFAVSPLGLLKKKQFPFRQTNNA